MNRRSFLSFLGLAPAAIIAPKKTFVFFGNIYRPRGICVVNGIEYNTIQEAVESIPDGGKIYIREGTYRFTPEGLVRISA